MAPLLALDVAILLPADVARRAVELSAAIPRDSDDDLRLGGNQLPHITLTQQFVRTDRLPAVLERLDHVLKTTVPLRLRISGSGRMNRSLWMAIERGAELVDLHERLMEVLRPFEQTGGDAAAFVDGNARDRDVLWVAGYRATSSVEGYTPHITLGHGDIDPQVAPRTFTATTVAACHLGRFCSCQRVLRAWEMSPT